MSDTGPRVSRWWLVVVAALALGTSGLYQFAWSSIRVGLGPRTGATEAALGTAFTLYVVFQTGAQFPVGWVRDRVGPRLPTLVGAACLAAGFGGLAVADSLPVVYLSMAVGGVGGAAIYTVAVNTAVKWFTDRRGLATGVVTMSFSGVSFLLIPSIRRGIPDSFAPTLFGLAAVTGAAALLAALVLRDPGEDGSADREKTSTDREQTSTDGEAHPADGVAYGWRKTVRTWQFWLLYAVFVVVNGVGLMVIGKVVGYAGELSLPGSVLTAAASAVALGDALGIIVVGGASDYFGRERSLAWSLALGGLSLCGAVLAGEAGLAAGFVVLVAATLFFRSPAFAIYPAIVGTYYGRVHSSENYAAMYTAKLIGGVFGGSVASLLVVRLGWSRSFALGGLALLLSGVALAFLRPVDR